MINIEKDKKNRNRVLKIYKLNSFHTINGQEYKIFIIIRETVSGILYYDHEGVKIKKHVRQTRGASKEAKSTTLSTSNVLSNDKVTKKSSTAKTGLKGRTQLDPAWYPRWGQFKNKPKEAIKHLMKVKKGDALSALYRKEIGFIDIVWGENDPKTNKGFGLKHIIEKHGKEIEQLGFKVEDFIPIIVMFGNYEISKQKSSRVILNGNTFRIVIEKDKGGKKFVLTAFDLRSVNKKGLGSIGAEINIEKLRKHNKIVDGVGFTIPPLYGTTLTSKNKDTKKSKTTKKHKKYLVTAIVDTAQPLVNTPVYTEPSNQGPEPQEPPETHQPKIIKKAPGVTSISQAKVASKDVDYFNFNGDLAQFIGKLERKPRHSVVITLDAPPGSGKTRAMFQFVNMAAASGYSVEYFLILLKIDG